MEFQLQGYESNCGTPGKHYTPGSLFLVMTPFISDSVPPCTALKPSFFSPCLSLCLTLSHVTLLGEHDPLDPEYSILKQRLARRLRYERFDVSKLDLPSITALAERTITNVSNHVDHSHFNLLGGISNTSFKLDPNKRLAQTLIDSQDLDYLTYHLPPLTSHLPPFKEMKAKPLLPQAPPTASLLEGWGYQLCEGMAGVGGDPGSIMGGQIHGM